MEEVVSGPWLQEAVGEEGGAHCAHWLPFTGKSGKSCSHLAGPYDDGHLHQSLKSSCPASAFTRLRPWWRWAQTVQRCGTEHLLPPVPLCLLPKLLCCSSLVAFWPTAHSLWIPRLKEHCYMVPSSHGTCQGWILWESSDLGEMLTP